MKKLYVFLLLFGFMFSIQGAFSIEITPKNDKKNSSAIDKSTYNINWAPYMKNLEDKIKKNWNPPLDTINPSKRAVTILVIDKKGNITDYKIKKSSGDKSFDELAIKAIEMSAPVKPLPSEYEKDSIEVEFTFYTGTGWAPEMTDTKNRHYSFRNPDFKQTY